MSQLFTQRHRLAERDYSRSGRPVPTARRSTDACWPLSSAPAGADRIVVWGSACGRLDKGASPQPDESCRGRLLFSRKLTQRPAVRAGRPPPRATPRCVDHDAKCASAGQVRCRCANEESNTDATPAIPRLREPNLTPNYGSAAPSLLRRFRDFARAGGPFGAVLVTESGSSYGS